MDNSYQTESVSMFDDNEVLKINHTRPKYIKSKVIQDAKNKIFNRKTKSSCDQRMKSTTFFKKNFKHKLRQREMNWTVGGDVLNDDHHNMQKPNCSSRNSDVIIKETKNKNQVALKSKLVSFRYFSNKDSLNKSNNHSISDENSIIIKHKEYQTLKCSYKPSNKQNRLRSINRINQSFCLVGKTSKLETQNDYNEA